MLTLHPGSVLFESNYYYCFLAISSLLHLMAFNHNLIIVLFSGYVMTEMCSSPSKANDYFKSKMVNILKLYFLMFSSWWLSHTPKTLYWSDEDCSYLEIEHRFWFWTHVHTILYNAGFQNFHKNVIYLFYLHIIEFWWSYIVFIFLWHEFEDCDEPFLLSFCS